MALPIGRGHLGRASARPLQEWLASERSGSALMSSYEEKKEDEKKQGPSLDLGIRTLYF